MGRPRRRSSPSTCASPSVITSCLTASTLTVEPGSVFALLGPNGAGKTTMVRILATLLEPDHGEIRVAGHDVAREPDAVRDAIGVTGQFSAVDELLTGRENLALMADLHHLARDDARRGIGELLDRFELVDAADRMVVTYSGGMRRRLDLAMTLMGAPQVIFLDEPTTGLDPRSRRTMWDIVRSLAGDGTTVFLTTQYLEEADQLADRVAILDRGRIVAQGTAQRAQATDPRGSHRSELRRRRHTAGGRRSPAASGRRRRCPHFADPHRRQRRDTAPRPARTR